MKNENDVQDLISVSVMIHEGGYKVLKIHPNMLGELAKLIYKNGIEWITLQSGPIQIVGFMVTGNQTGDRVIILGNKETAEVTP